MSKLFLHIFLLMSFCAKAQVHWEVNAEKRGAHAFLFTIDGTIDKGWHVYGQEDPKNGLTPLRIRILNTDYFVTGTTEPIRDAIFSHAEEKVFKTYFTFSQFVNIKDDIPASVPVTLSGFAANDSVFLPIEEIKQVTLAGGVSAEAKIKLQTINLQKPLSECGDKRETKSILAIFFLGLVGGLLALLTPCVFPMIPLTVSFFIRQEKKKYGILYGFFILYIYMMASLPFHIAGNLDPEIFNVISTSPWVNLAFFVIFVVFALSFFGLFDITLPASVADKINNRGAITSLPGIFFMALTLAIVSFSCTGPILGSLLAGSANAGAWALTAGMTGFGIALGLPFALFAIFPQWINRMPKSGSWLKSVKIILAFVELAFAFKFLSNADLVGHWGILKREVFICIWIAIALFLTFYLFGLFGRDFLEPARQQAIKISLGFGVFIFTGYLILGLFGFELSLLSGFPPPKSYSIFETSNKVEPRVVNDYEKAVAMAKEQNKPILIDFTGWACVNCRKMEENVWTSPAIASAINENYILVSLYVDDRKALKQMIRYKDKDLITQGDRWATFESENFAQVSQPLHVLVTPDGLLLNHPVGYTPNEKEYGDWLECGMNAFKKTN